MKFEIHEENAGLTGNPKLVMDLLEVKKSPLSAYMILDELRDSGLRAPLQVYRALEKLISLGRVHRVESLNAFIACNHMSCENSGVSAFVICDKCEHVQEVCDESISRFLNYLAKKTKMKASKSNIELHGICDACESL